MHEDPLPIRTHLSVSTTITPFIIPIGTVIELSGGLTAGYTGGSLPYDLIRWSPYIALGPSMEITILLGDLHAVSASIALLGGIYTSTWDLSTITRLTIAVHREMDTQSAHHRLVLKIPFTVDLRSDYISLSTGIALMWRYGREDL